MKVSERLEKLYRNRFSDRELYEKNRVMKVLCDSFFQKYIARDAVDIREDISNFANPDVVFPRFLPPSIKSKIPTHPLLIKIYLKMRFIWKIKGKLMFIFATKP